MKQLYLSNVKDYVEKNIGTFHSKRLLNLQKLKLKNVLKRKNPYLFKAKNILTAHNLIKGLLDAHLSSQEETIFGDFLEGLAVFICSKVFEGRKSTAEGIDLEFERDGIRYIVSIKSGPNWGNSSQIRKMRDNFRQAKKILGANISQKNIVAVNGCCYGKLKQTDKGDYIKLCGQEFWEFISDNTDLYLEIIEPLGSRAKEKNEEFLLAYSQLMNKFTFEFSKEFCDDGKINWGKLIKFNSEKH